MSAVDPAAVVGKDCVIRSGAVVEAGAVLGEGCVVDCGAVIRKGVQVGPGTRIGAHSVLGAGEDGRPVLLGKNCVLGCGVILHTGVTAGDRVRMDDGCSVGKLPLRSPHSAMTGPAAPKGTFIGRDCQLGTGAVVYDGAVLGEQVLLADGAGVREDSSVGEGTIVGRGAYVENRVRVGRRCKIESGAYLCALTTVEDDCFVGPGVLTANDDAMGRGRDRARRYRGPVLKRGARLGAGVLVLPGRVLGEEAAAAAGSLVTGDLTGGGLYLGRPARLLRPVSPEQRL